MLVAALLLGAVACGSGTPGADTPAETVRGFILEVGGESLLVFESLTVADEAGVMWTFQAKGKTFASFTPAHLREHMLLGLPVEVAFHREEGALVLDEISD